MVKSLIVYFTQGGTTEHVAEAIATGLRSREHQVDLHNMNDGQPPRLDGYGLLGIGLPVYIFRPPFKVTEYIHNLPGLKGLPFFVFLLYGTFSGDTGNIVRDALTRKGGHELGYFKAKGADYYLGYLKRGYLFSPDNPTALELDSAQAFGRVIADRIAGGEYIRQKDNSPPSFVHEDATELGAFGDQSFDYAAMLMVMHELPRLQQVRVLKEALRVARRGIIIDSVAPLPKNVGGIGICIVEETFGRDHNPNFKAFLAAGGIRGMLQESGMPISVEYSSVFWRNCREVVVVSSQQ